MPAANTKHDIQLEWPPNSHLLKSQMHSFSSLNIFPFLAFLVSTHLRWSQPRQIAVESQLIANCGKKLVCCRPFGGFSMRLCHRGRCAGAPGPCAQRGRPNTAGLCSCVWLYIYFGTITKTRTKLASVAYPTSVHFLITAEQFGPVMNKRRQLWLA
jgi:hypothetical protein